MAAPQLELIGAILSSKNLNLASAYGLTRKMLAGCADAVTLYEAIVRYADENGGRVPDVSYLKAKFPDVDIPEVPGENLLGVLEVVQEAYLDARLNSVLERAVNIANSEGSKVALEFIIASCSRLASEGSARKLDLIVEAAIADSVLKAYEENKQRQGILGATWPWPELDKYTQGIVPGKYNVVYGVKKSMKTWLMLFIVNHYYNTTDERILLYLREMTQQETLERLAMLRARVNAWKFQKGLLSPEEEQRLRTELFAMKEEFDKNPSKARLVMMRCPRGDHASVQDVAQRIRAWGTKFVFVDSMYLMANDQQKGRRSTDWKNVGDISGAFADMAHDEGVAVFTTTQENERELRKLGPIGGATISYASKILMDADFAFHVMKFYDKTRKSTLYPRGEPELGLMFPAGRGFDVPPFTIRALPAESFAFKHWGVRKMESAQSEEEADSEPAPTVDIRTSFTGTETMIRSYKELVAPEISEFN